MLATLTGSVKNGTALTDAQVVLAVAELIQEEVAADVKAEFLTALALKGETEAEIAAFARALRDMSLTPPLDAETRAGEILDVVGTGGDRLNTFNISTTVALLAASAGIRVAKHGNRAVTSKSGSADVLEALGIRTDLSPVEAAASLKNHHFAFFFAPAFHPAFRHIAPARKLCAQRGQRTLFNILGPLLNPARPTAQLTGVPHPRWCGPLAAVHKALGVRRGMVVCGRVGDAWLDELSTLGENTIAEYRLETDVIVSTTVCDPYRVRPATLADLVGGDARTNAAIVRDILTGRERGPKRDAVLFNAGAALFVAGRVSSIDAGWDLAAELIESGQAEAKLRELAG